MNIIRTAILFLALAFGAGKVLAQDFQKGMAAAQAGDFATALKEWHPLAEQGVAAAQYNLGVIYHKGEGVLQNYAEALKWYRLATEQRHTGANYNLGSMYYYGNGVLKENIKAHMWYNLASANGKKGSLSWRDETAKEMTSTDISKAEKMAQECMISNYQNCGW